MSPKKSHKNKKARSSASVSSHGPARPGSPKAKPKPHRKGGKPAPFGGAHHAGARSHAAESSEPRFEFRDRSGKVHGRPTAAKAHEPHAPRAGHAPKISPAAPKGLILKGGPVPHHGSDFEPNKKSNRSFAPNADRPLKDRGGKHQHKDAWGSGRKEKRAESRGGGHGEFRSGARGEERGALQDKVSLFKRGFKSARTDRRPEGREKRGGHERKRRIGTGVEVKLKATVDKNHKGFGFLLFENRTYEDAFVPPRDAESLFHGDRVEVTISARGDVSDIKVLGHRFRELVGRFSAHPAGAARGGWIVYERKRAREEIFVPKPDPRAKAGDWVKGRLEFHENGPYTVTAEITDVYGAELPPSADIGMVSAEYNLIEEHSEEAKREARAMRIEVPGKDLEGRTDLRHIPLITIDGETARDFDDAVYVERSKTGYVLWVGIADVSHYVKDGTALDQEARSRGTSVYFPERAFHMLPRELSESLCSLRPNEPRLSMVARMEYDRQGKRHKTELFEAVIESKRRATYNQIQEEWDANKENSEWEFAPHFELYQIIRKTRAQRGSIDFDFPEPEIKVEPTGEVISIRMRARWDSHRLIEEFMIAANESVTEWMLERSWPFLYRVHEEPAQTSLLKFQQLAANFGVHFSLESDESAPKILADLVRRLVGNPAQDLLNMALLRSMKQAIYSSTHGIHFGLASEGYTHFTSPIRRYPDLVVHRLLRWALQVEQKKLPALKPQEREDLEQELVEICEHCSYRERLASDAERESIKLKQVRAMLKHVGDEFDAKVTGMTESGLFVAVPDPYAEGLVHKDTMMDDFYEYIEDRMIFLGRRKKRAFKIGDPLRVRVLRADIDKRQIDFGLLESETSKPATQDFNLGKQTKSHQDKKTRKEAKPGKKRRVDPSSAT